MIYEAIHVVMNSVIVRRHCSRRLVLPFLFILWEEFPFLFFLECCTVEQTRFEPLAFSSDGISLSLTLYERCFMQVEQ